MELSDTESSFFLIDDYGNFSWMNKGRVNDILNECMVHVADNMKTPYASLGNQDQYWTSSTVSDDQARVIMFDNASFVYSWWYRKYFQWSCAPYSDSDRKGSDPTGRKPSAASAAEGPGHRPQAKAGGKDRGKKGAAGHDAPRIRLAHTGNGPCAQSEIKKRQVAYFRATCFFRMASTSAKASRRKSADSTT